MLTDQNYKKNILDYHVTCTYAG